MFKIARGLSGGAVSCLALLLTAGSSISRSHAETPAGASGFLNDLWTRDTLLDDTGGFRSNLADVGVSIGLQDTNEVFGNTSGGIHTGAAYSGLTMLSVGVDTKAAHGWEGGIFNASLLNIRGRGLSGDNLLALQTVSGIVARPTTRLWELWFQKSFGNRFDIKLGQQSLDLEFMTSQGSSLFLNTMMGWPMVPSVDLYAGGPAYPLSSLGVRVRARPGDAMTIIAGVFNDNPPGGSFLNDSQLRGAERTGTLFNLNTGALFIAELQYVINQPTPAEGDKQSGPSDTGAGGLPGTYKLGAWFDTASFTDQKFDNAGLSLANPISTGVPANHSRNFSVYGVMDQTIWQQDSGDARAIGVFARLMGAPGDRNLVSFSVNAGVTMKAPLPSRDKDTLGLGFGFTKVSGGAIAFDRAINYYGGTRNPVRSSEMFVELTYQLLPASWWIVQPDFQYIVRPGGGIQNPNAPGQRVGDEAVFGMRSVMTF